MSEADQLQAILNLACVVMARRSTPAQKARAEYLLCSMEVMEAEAFEIINGVSVKSWFNLAREACPQWRDI